MRGIKNAFANKLNLNKPIGLLLISILFHDIGLGQKPVSDAYKIYSTIIKSEISDSTKSIGIIKINIDSQSVNDNTSAIANAIKSQNMEELGQIFFWTENGQAQRPVAIDDITQSCLSKFFASPPTSFILANKFYLNTQIYLLKRNPIAHVKNWGKFYHKNPGSGGIFSFSVIKYFDTNPDTAIVYYWHRRHGLNGYGAITVLAQINYEWKIKYKIYTWWN